MSAPPKASGEPIDDRRQLVSHLEGGCKPPTAWRIGTEHEKFVFDTNTLRRVPYEGPNGIRALMEGLTRFGWVLRKYPVVRSPSYLRQALDRPT